jgi:CMP-N,N'-diacetyllegionaminic acid synthase
MLNGHRILSIIPARGGSQGLPGKNIKLLQGKPLIAYSIEKARKCQEIDYLMVSTDDEQIAQIARQYGADVPFLRAPELATHTTPMIPVIVDAVRQLMHSGATFDYAIMLQANSPLIQQADIQRVLHTLIQEHLEVVFTVCQISHPPQWALILELYGPQFAFFHDEGQLLTQRQAEQPLFRSTGAVYAVKIDYLLQHQQTARLCLPARGQRTGTIITDPLSAIDIDHELDFYLAETILAKGLGNAS